MAAWTAGLRAELGSCNVIIQEIDPGQTNTNMAKVRIMEATVTGMNESSQFFILNLFLLEFECCIKMITYLLKTLPFIEFSNFYIKLLPF